MKGGKCNIVSGNRILPKPRCALGKNGRRWHYWEKCYGHDILKAVGVRPISGHGKQAEIVDALHNEQKVAPRNEPYREVVIQDPSSNESDVSQNQQKVALTEEPEKEIVIQDPNSNPNNIASD